jgi:hypothetical protein
VTTSGMLNRQRRLTRPMNAAQWGQLGALFAAILGGAGLYFEITVVIVVATVAAMVSVVLWMRATAPHDHWRQFQRRNPWDP